MTASVVPLGLVVAAWVTTSVTAGAATGLTVHVAYNSGDSVTPVDVATNTTGTAGNDTLNGTNHTDVICGLGGNGNDTLYGRSPPRPRSHRSAPARGCAAARGAHSAAFSISSR